MVDSVQEKWYLCILMEHASKGDVLQLIDEHKAKERYIDEALIWKLAQQMGEGLQYLHR
jgi:serine/threonine protein kinase